jgi:SpoVK/Ycf46/Vps4 family AAA+-type ATPase
LSLLSGETTDGFTGADLKALCTEAALEAAKRARDDPDGVVKMEDFQTALKSVCASVTASMQTLYDSMVAKFGKG